jgi:hypothetical protein
MLMINFDSRQLDLKEAAFHCWCGWTYFGYYETLDLPWAGFLGLLDLFRSLTSSRSSDFCANTES